jgi:hypothetical protein
VVRKEKTVSFIPVPLDILRLILQMWREVLGGVGPWSAMQENARINAFMKPRRSIIGELTHARISAA